MWSRSDLKERGKLAFKSNYLNCLIVSVILSVLTAASMASNKTDTDTTNGKLDDLLQNPFVTLAVAGIAFGAVILGLIISLLITIFLKNPIIVGAYRFYIDNSINDEKTGLEDLLFVYKKGHFSSIFWAMFMRALYVAIWSLLLIVPGIVKAYSYRMVPFILAENPDIEWREALERSSEMMNGHKMNTFMLDISFAGWWILSLITGGIVGVFYYNPYYYATNTELYLTLSGQI